MVKDDQGVWSVTTDPLAPDYYGYAFVADGVACWIPQFADEAEPAVERQRGACARPGVRCRGKSTMCRTASIHHHFYRSAVVGDDRDYLCLHAARL